MVAWVRRHPAGAARAVLLSLTILFAYLGFSLYRDSASNIDAAALWLAVSLLCLTLVTSSSRRLPELRRKDAVALLRRHWLELVLFSAVIAFIASLRLTAFDRYPPSGVIYGEEGLNGRAAYGILHGERPLAYPLTRYPAALGFWLWGENTTGLRLPFVLAGIVTAVPFYLLARELVRPVAALFATLLLGSSRLLVDPYNQLDVRILGAVLFFYLFVRGVRTGSPLLLVSAGVLAGVLSYEWPAFAGAPIVALAFAAALTVKGLVWPLPSSLALVSGRAARLVHSRWRSAVAFVGAALIVSIPMMVAHSRDDQIYLHDFERHREGTAQVTPGLLASDWPVSLKWAAELFLPFGPQSFPFTPISEGLRLVDPFTGTLLGVAVLLCLITFFRPYRALLAGYFVLGMLGTALVADPFRAWRFIPFLPLGLLLIAFVVDDLEAAARRFLPRFLAYGVAAVLAAGLAYASVNNVRAIFGTIVDDPNMPRVVFINTPERPYALCDYMRTHDDDGRRFYVHWDDEIILGFTRRNETFEESLQAFGDMAWFCRGLRGLVVPAPLEAWPLRPAPAGPATIVVVTSPQWADDVAGALRLAYPDSGELAVISYPAPGGFFSLVAYEFSAEEARALPGLYGRYQTLDGRLLEERVDPMASLRWEDGNTPPLPFTVRWHGAVYLDRPALASLVAVSDDPAQVLVDGLVSFSSQDGAPPTFPRDLAAGWHVIEVSAFKQTAGGSMVLRWVDAQGNIADALAAPDLFPLRSLPAWRHRRTLVSTGLPLDAPVTERFDFGPYEAPHYLVALQSLLNDRPPRPSAAEVRVLREEWSTIWHVSLERDYRLQADLQGALTVTLDGAVVLSIPEGGQDEVDLRVPPGQHRLELVATLSPGGRYAGLTFTITEPPNPSYRPAFTPY
jgi:hypothetical protein